MLVTLTLLLTVCDVVRDSAAVAIAWLIHTHVMV